MDADNYGALEKEDLKLFIASLLIGITGEKETAADLLERHKIVFSILDDIDGEVMPEELPKLCRDLFKEVIKDLQNKLESVNRGKVGEEDD